VLKSTTEAVPRSSMSGGSRGLQATADSDETRAKRAAFADEV
jgi:hypothetical protein